MRRTSFLRFGRPWRAVLTVGLLAVAGCADLPGLGPPPNLYTLSPKSTYGMALPEVGWQLVVEEPIAAGGLDTVRIALQPTPLEIKYFAGARWTERAPKMVQTLLVESFENTGRIVAVGRQSIGLRSDYNLKSELREFQADYAEGGETQPPVIRVRLNVKLIRQPEQEIVASQTFERTVRATGGDMDAIIIAFDEALNRVLRDTVAWTLTTPPSAGGDAARGG